MPAKSDVQFELPLKTGSLVIPQTHATVPADCSFLWPFNLDLAGVHLVYATAQPIAQIEHTDGHYFFFFQTADVPADFVHAAVWRLHLSPNPAGRDLLLRIHYTGDVARIYHGDKLLVDNFFNGDPFDVGLMYLNVRKR